MVGFVWQNLALVQLMLHYPDIFFNLFKFFEQVKEKIILSAWDFRA